MKEVDQKTLKMGDVFYIEPHTEPHMRWQVTAMDWHMDSTILTVARPWESPRGYRLPLRDSRTIILLSSAEADVLLGAT